MSRINNAFRQQATLSSVMPLEHTMNQMAHIADLIGPDDLKLKVPKMLCDAESGHYEDLIAYYDFVLKSLH